MNNEIMIVKQLPVIEEQLKLIRAEIEEKTSLALTMVCTEDNYKEIKKLRADLKHDFDVYEDKRKEIKKAVLAPYEAFEEKYRENIGELFKDADAKLKAKIDEVEVALKDERVEEIKAYYDEYAQSLGIDFFPFERSGIKINLSDSKKKQKEACSSFLDRVSNDLMVINSREDAGEVMVEYKNYLDLGRAIMVADIRRKAVADEKAKSEARAKAAEAEAQAAEIIKDMAKAAEETISAPEEIYELVFVVKGTLTQLKALKHFLSEGGYKYE